MNDLQESTAAQAAAMIRKELKANGVKATVRSKTYSGGDSVTVTLADPLPAVRREVEAFCDKFQAGRFNGMEDIYEYDNANADLPQVKFVFVQADYSAELKQAAKEYIAANFCGLEGFEVDRMAYQALSGSLGVVGWRCSFWTDRKPRARAA